MNYAGFTGVGVDFDQNNRYNHLVITLLRKEKRESQASDHSRYMFQQGLNGLLLRL
jgi:hypothetical protein